MESASEESMHQLLKSSMEITSSLRKDFDGKKDLDYEKVESLSHVWKTICKIRKANVVSVEDEEISVPEYENTDAKDKVEEMMKLMSSPTIPPADPSEGPAARSYKTASV